MATNGAGAAMLALVDCNSFFASCEQVFRPDLRGKPVVVLSNNDGFVVARTKEAQALGVRSLAAYHKVEGLLRRHGVAVFSSNYPLYGDISARFIATMRDFSPRVEVYGIDELFLDLGGDHYAQQGRQIVDRLWRDLRLPVGVGVAPTKTLAKLAMRWAKQLPRLGGVCVLDRPHKWEWALRRTPLDHVWGIAGRSAARLQRLGLRTAWDLAHRDLPSVRSATSRGYGDLQAELRGQPRRALDHAPAPRKQIYCTRSFGKKAQSLQPILQALSLYAARACEKLRAQGSLALSVHAFFHTSPHRPGYHVASRMAELPYPTSDTRVVTAAVLGMARRMYAADGCGGRRYLKAGVGLTRVVPDAPQQRPLFGRAQTERDERLMRALDGLNRRHGSGTVFLASQGTSRPWYMRQRHRSPSYTTSWADIPVARC